MIPDKLKSAKPGTEEYEALKLKAMSGDAEAGKQFAYACVWHSISKLRNLSERKKNLMFRKLVFADPLAVTIV